MISDTGELEIVLRITITANGANITLEPNFGVN